jgi:hypothetical protein
MIVRKDETNLYQSLIVLPRFLTRLGILKLQIPQLANDIKGCEESLSKIQDKTKLAEAYLNRKSIQCSQRSKVSTVLQAKLEDLEGLCQGKPKFISKLKDSELASLLDSLSRTKEEIQKLQKQEVLEIE